MLNNNYRSDNMITTLNPTICILAMFVTAFGLTYNACYNVYSIVTFLVGIIATYPIIKKVWNTIESNWTGVYKKFYSSHIFKRKFGVAKKSWKLTWWLVPYCLVVYLTINFIIIYYTQDSFLLESFALGAIFTVFAITYAKGKKYYKQVK